MIDEANVARHSRTGHRASRSISLRQGMPITEIDCLVDPWVAGGEHAGGASGVRAIIFPEAGLVRSRNVVSRSNARSTGKYPSWKMGRMLHWESNHELNAFRLLDCDPNVTSFSEQPCKVVYVIDGVQRTHYPDILVSTKEGKQLWEVKLRSAALAPEVEERTACLSLALPRWGYRYQTVLGEDLASQPRLNNANLILSYGSRAVTDCEWDTLEGLFPRRVLWSGRRPVPGITAQRADRYFAA
jgi:hypothetical protein